MGKADEVGGPETKADGDLFPAPSAGVRWLLGVTSLAAVGICGYLLYISLGEGRSPAGCGPGSGCQAVLGSRWSNVGGVPVSAPAALVWLAAILAVRYACPRKIAAVRQAAWAALVVIAAAVGGAAVWFLSLQAIALEALCPWCLAVHSLGVVFAGIVSYISPKRRSGFHPAAIAGLASLGVCLTGSLIAAQLVMGPPLDSVERVAGGHNEDQGVGPDRRISVLNGELMLAPIEEPMLGSPDAPKLLVLLFDYRCTHCRETHRFVREALQKYRGELGVILMPAPLSAECNPLFRTTEPEFEEACEIAELALAVWQAAPEKFAEFDAWLIDAEKPPRLAEARRRAEELATREQLDAAMAGKLGKRSPRQQIARNVKAYADTASFNSQLVLPMILSPQIDTIIGKPSSENELFELLETELAITLSSN